MTAMMTNVLDAFYLFAHAKPSLFCGKKLTVNEFGQENE